MQSARGARLWRRSGRWRSYDRDYYVDIAQLTAFLRASQPEIAESRVLDEDDPTRRRFLVRLQGEIAKRGTTEVLRHGIRHGAHSLELFYGTPSPGKRQAAERFAQNLFSVMRQLRYSRDEAQRALDIVLFLRSSGGRRFRLPIDQPMLMDYERSNMGVIHRSLRRVAPGAVSGLMVGEYADNFDVIDIPEHIPGRVGQFSTKNQMQTLCNRTLFRTACTLWQGDGGEKRGSGHDHGGGVQSDG